MRKIVSVALLCCVALFETACPSTPYGKAASVGLNVTQTLHTGADTVDKLHTAGDISSDEEKQALKDMNAINDLDIVYGTCVQNAHMAGNSSAAFLGCAQAFLSGVKTGPLLTDFHITNPHSQQTIIAIGETVVTLLETAITELSK